MFTDDRRSPTTPTPLPERNLDFIRAIGTLIVLSCHIAGWQHLTPFMRWIGLASVLAFFMHTTLVLLSSLERDGAPYQAGWIRRFYVRRAFRIYPLSCVVILLVLWWQVPPGLGGSTFQPPSLSAILTNLALVQNLAGHHDVFGVLWTLPIEVQMYLVLPLCFVVVRLRSPVWTMLLLTGVVIGIAICDWDSRQATSAFHIPGLWRLGAFWFAPSFLMGTVAFRLLRRRAQIPPPLPTWTWLPFLVLVIGVPFLLVPQWLERWPARLIYSGVLALTIPLIRDAAPGVMTRVAHTIATYSYGIYLVQLLALRVAFDGLRGQPMVLRWTAMAVVLIGGSYVAYHAIEKPGMALGRWLMTRRPRNRVEKTYDWVRDRKAGRFSVQTPDT